MNGLRFLAAASPVLLIAVLVVFWKMSALALSLWGIVLTAVIAATVFHTSIGVILLGGLDGFVTTFPLLLTVFGGIILSVLLIGTGALPRIVSALSKGFRNPMHQVNGICFGIENFVAGAGIITEPIIAPTLRTVGLPPRAAAILASWGYAGIMSFTLAGVFIVILSIVTGLDAQRLAVVSAYISLVPALISGLAVAVVIEARDLARGHLLFNTLVGLASGILTLVFVLYVSASTACMLTGIALLGGIVLLSGSKPDYRAVRFADVLPFLILIVGLSVANMYQPLRVFGNDHAVVTISVFPAHIIRIKPLLDPYTYLVIAIAATLVGLRITWGRFLAIVRPAMPRALRALTAMMIFGAMGQIIAFTGYDTRTESVAVVNNIPYVLASGLSGISGRFYPVFAPVLGWAGTFLTGYGSLSIMIFGRLQVEIAQLINVSPEVLAAAMTVGSGIGSISSPFKVAMATALVDAVGKEGEILRKTIPIGIAISLVTGLWSLLLARIL